MSGKSKQGVCVTTAILYFQWLSKAIVSAKQATYTSPQREMRSQGKVSDDSWLIYTEVIQQQFCKRPSPEQVCPIFLFN